MHRNFSIVTGKHERKLAVFVKRVNAKNPLGKMPRFVSRIRYWIQ